MKINRILRNNYLHLKNLILVIIPSFFIGILPGFLVKLRQLVIDIATGAEAGFKSTDSIRFLLILLAVHLVIHLLKGLSNLINAYVRTRTQTRLGNFRLKKAISVRYDISETENFRELLAQTGETHSAVCSIYSSISSIITAASKILVVVAITAAINWTIPCLIAALLLIGIPLNIMYSKRMDGFWQGYISHMRRSNYLSSLLIDRSFMHEKKLFGFFNKVNNDFEESFNHARKKNSVLGASRFRIDVLMELLSCIYLFLIPAIMLPLLLKEDLSLGMYTSLFYATSDLMVCGKLIYGSVFQLRIDKIKLNSWADFMELDSSETKSSKDISIEPKQIESIEFKNVSFKYPGSDKLILNSASFKLECGKHYALVGENGSGKSTIVKLILGLYEPISGKILINGSEIERFSRAAICKLISSVFQDFYSYPLTVREIVSLGRTSLLKDAELYPLMQAVNLYEKIAALPKGFDTNLVNIKQDGIELSGGQWQKLAIARCIASPAYVAILDEPNAALDPISEAEIYKAYGELLKDKLTLFISHRLGSVSTADEILVLRNGRIEAQAPHNKLMETNPYYGELYTTQRSLYYGKN